VHIPRAVADLSVSNETTAVFEALAFSGVAFLIAAAPTEGRLKSVRHAAETTS
jgi:hypothetical protein